ncbi:hypothetical protein SAMN02745163_03232 [Clostridium cavendishii DSM 21758]|uniref:Uncharacterized protein n=1 Tax=Clostridium cavendishii DSM 21758 TaxID=1121302 RepID=A0A1M6PQV4_9CLOT|nr:hypothetical protein [Clostridium cavendishii]SHK10307.1 hypothetical protein SAMN02745163_03232 [Clostridium cavendishii DSM 21758]
MIIIDREKSYFDRLRKYKIMLDDTCIGTICSDEKMSFEIPEGNHTIYMKIDWCRSNKINFYMKENSTIKFECGNNIHSSWRGFICFVYISILRTKYLYINIKQFN